MPTPFRDLCNDLVTGLRDEAPDRTPSLLTTVFGDVVTAHGGEIWLGSLIKLLAPMGISERLVRTSVNRLARDGWLQGMPQGRRSYYRLTERARRTSEQFEQRIYHPVQRQWNGSWRLVFTGTQGITAEQRAVLRKRLGWLGFGTIAANVYAHPTTPLEPLWELFEQVGVERQVVVMEAAKHHQALGLDNPDMARQCFMLEPLQKEYQAFTRRYEALAKAIQDNPRPANCEPEQGFVLRTLLIHQFRRILLKDPDLPAVLLPEPWAGYRAQQLCGSIYRAIHGRSEQYIMAQGEHRNGRFSATSKPYRGRFRDPTLKLPAPQVTDCCR